MVSYQYKCYKTEFWNEENLCRAQRGPTTGRRAACDPPRRFQWPAEAFRKNLQIWNCWKAYEVTFVSAKGLWQIKCILNV